MNNKPVSKKLLTIRQTAGILNVHPETLRRWDRQGRLKAVRLGTRQNWGDRKYRSEDIEALRNEKNGQNPLRSNEPKLTNHLGLVQLTERQKKIWQYLTDTNPKAADAYVGAIRVREDQFNPDRIAQSAHSLRELNLILVPKSASPQPKQDEYGHISRIKSYMKSQDLLGGLPEEVAGKVAKQWVDTYDWFCKVAHHGPIRDNKEFDHEVQILENIIESQIGPFYNSIEKLDQLLAKSRLTSADIVSLRTHIKKYAHYEYFFKNLSNPAWLDILSKEGYFATPPDLIRDDVGGIRYLAWVESEYLIKIADRKPNEICQLILKSKQTENTWVHCDFIETAIKMPSDVAIQLLPKIKKESWFNDHFMSRSADKGGDLMIKLVRDNKIDEACKLADLILDIKKVERLDNFGSKDMSKKSYEVKSCIDNWQFKQILEHKLPALVEADPIRAIILLRNLLEKAIRHVTCKNDYEDTESLHFKRPMIEDDEQNWSNEDVENLLITAIRKAIELVSNKKPTLLKQSVATLSHQEGTYSILLRIQLNAYAKNPRVFSNETLEALRNEKNLFDKKICYEYGQLLKITYAELPDEVQNLILDLIKKGPGEKITREYLEYWQTQKLDLIKDSLPKVWKQQYETLVKKYKVALSQRNSYTATWHGPTSPESEVNLLKKSSDEVIKLLIGWTPIKDFMASSPEGLGRVFEEIVVKNPVTYSKKFKEIFDAKVRAVYLYHLICGLKKAHKQGVTIDWTDILPTFDSITSTKIPFDYPRDEGIYETGWRGVRKSIVDFFEEIFKKGFEIPFKYRGQVWTILARLAEDSDPDIEHEKKYGGRNMNPVTLSINTVRGDAFHALIQYSLWVSRNTYPDESNTILPTEVKTVLEKHLDPEVDPTETTRSVYGYYYPTLYYLDKDWATANLDKIFRPFGDRLPLAAWRTYIGYASLWIPVVNFLKPLYEEAVNHLSKNDKTEETNNRLAEHLMISYWRGDISLEDKILNCFYKNAPETVRAHAVWFLWRSLEEAKLQKNSAEWKRVKLLWQQRLKEVNIPRSDEISGFADWLNCIPVDINELSELIKETIPHLTRGADVGYLISYLKSNIGVNIDLVTELLHNTVKENTEEIKYRIHDQDISYILTAAIQSESERARDFANKTINMFGERGNPSFKGILSKSK